MKKYREKHHFSMLIVMIIISLIYLYRFNVIKTPYYSDELGYWAAGAWINGVDWSPTLSHSPYYGWGYGVILAPLFLINSSVLRFRVAVLVNIILVIGCYLLLVLINKKFFPQLNKNLIVVTAGVTILYSYNIVYAHITMCEIYLTFLFLLSIKVVISLCEKITIKNSLFLSFILMMQLATHLRTFVFTFALFLTICYLTYYRKISYHNIIALTGMVFIGILVTFIIKDRLISLQYINVNGSGDNIRPVYNDSFIQKFAMLKSFTSLIAWEKLFFSILGKWFYLSSASFFLVCIGLRYLVLNIILAIKNGKKFCSNNAVFIYIFTSFLCAFFLSAIQLMYPNRYDHIFYGRYTENVIPIIINIGLLTVINSNGNDKMKEVNFYILCGLGISIMLYHYIKKQSFESPLPLETSVFAGIIRESSNYDMQFTIYAILFTVLISILFYLLLKKSTIYACVVLAIVWSVIAYKGLELCAYPELERQDCIIEATEKIDALDKNVWTLIPDDVNKNITAFVDILWLQFHLGEKTIHELKIENTDSIDDNDVLVISSNYPNAKIIVNQYSPLWENEKIYIIEGQSLKHIEDTNE